ncbi:MAG: adenylate/guanylate cyclase domain-containing protein, partial [bacterium]
DGKDYIVLSRPFQVPGDLTWNVFVVVPESHIFGQVRRNNKITAAVSGGILLVAVLVGLLVSRNIKQPIYRLYDELERVGQFILDENEPIKSFIKEIDVMGDSVQRTKKSLRSFEKYVPSDLVRRLQKQGIEAKLGGETREVTVFFADVAGFTGLSENVTPGELVEILGGILGGFSDRIQQYEGTVDKYIGDEIMAFWNAPDRVENHPVEACKCALECHEWLMEHRENLQDKTGEPLDVRIGLNTGEAIVGNMGSEARLNYTVLGDNVNLGSRIEGLNKIYGTPILIGEATRDRIGEALVVRKVDCVYVKGKSESSNIYELIGVQGEVEYSRIQLIDRYEEALERYQSGEWSEAIDRFQSVLDEDPDDTSAKVLLERCKQYREKPPENWDGVYQVTVK